MYLTKENYRDIERWLKLRGIKDIKFPRTDRVRDKDLVPIIQEGKNKIISAREFALQLGCIYVPDEEDITSVDSFEGLALKFKDKISDSTLYSGMGRKFVRLKLDVLPDLPIEEGAHGPKLKPLSVRRRKPLVNYLDQGDFPLTDTVYIIQYDHDLKGETIVIPENCALVFNGGTLNNGTVTVNETQIYGVIQLSDTGDVTYNGIFYDGQVMSFSNKSYVLTDDLYNNDDSTLDKPEVRYWNGTEWEKLSLYDEVTELQEEMDEAQADIDALEERMDTAEADIDALEERMDTAEADIDALETTVADHESRLSTAEGTILKLDEWVTSLDASVTSLNSSFESLYSDWLTIQSEWSSFKTTIQEYIDEFNTTINNMDAELDNYYTKTEVDELLANLSGSIDTGVGSISYAATTTSSSTGSYVIGKLTVDGTTYTLYGVDTQGEDTDLSDYYTKTEVDALITGSGSTVTYTKSYTGTDGIKLGTLTIDGTAYVIYAPSLEDMINYDYDTFEEYVKKITGDSSSSSGSTVSWSGNYSESDDGVVVIGTLTIDSTEYVLYAPTSETSSSGLTYTNTSEGFYVLGTTQSAAGTISTVMRRSAAIGSSTIPIYIASSGLATAIDSIDESLLPSSVVTEDNVGDYVSWNGNITAAYPDSYLIGTLTINGTDYPLYGYDTASSDGDSVSFEQTLTSGTEIGRITINGTETILYAPTSSSSDSSSDDDSSSDSDSCYWYLSGTNLYAGTSTTPSYAAYATAFYESSDRTLKENITDISQEALDSVGEIDIIQFNFKTGNKETKYGVIAQEVEEAGLQNLVSTNQEGLKAVDYVSLLSLKVANLEKKNKSLKSENADLKARLEKIESLLNINTIE